MGNVKRSIRVFFVLVIVIAIHAQKSQSTKKPFWANVLEDFWLSVLEIFLFPLQPEKEILLVCASVIAELKQW